MKADILNSRNIDVIIEARMTSTRLPGKVLKEACGKPMLELMVERCQKIPGVNRVIIATTVNKNDDCIADLAKKLGVLHYRGSEDDVLGRVVEAAQKHNTDIIVEITGDDPLLDPQLSGEVISAYLMNEDKYDYVANDVVETFPIGFNTRVFPRKLLERVEKATGHPVDREHVVNYIVKRPDEFKLLNVEAEEFYRNREIRLTLDTSEDYEVIKSVFENLYPKNPNFNAKEIVEFLEANPNIKGRNLGVVQRRYVYE